MAERSTLSLGAQSVLLALYDEEQGRGRALPGNEVAQACGFRHNMAKTGNSGRGNSTRVMGPAVHVVAALTSLRDKGFSANIHRDDGLSGSADVITDAGIEEAQRIVRADVVAYRMKRLGELEARKRARHGY